MKILVIDDEPAYLKLFRYLFNGDMDSLEVDYISRPENLYEVAGGEYGAVLCDFWLDDFGTAVDAYKVLEEKGFEGRFIIVTMASTPTVIESLVDAGIYGVEVIEKGRSYILRQVLYELTHE